MDTFREDTLATFEIKSYLPARISEINLFGYVAPYHFGQKYLPKWGVS